MRKTISFMEFELPKVTVEEVKHLAAVPLVEDPAAFAAELDALFQEKFAALELEAPATVEDALARKAEALRAESPWQPSATDIQRGRQAMLQAFEQPENLPLPEFAKLAHKSRQQIYKDLSARPKRLLALSVGPRRQRLPDWQLDPLRLRLTREVLKDAEGVDSWTLFDVLSEPLERLGGRSPVEAVRPSNFDEVVKATCSALGIH